VLQATRRIAVAAVQNAVAVLETALDKRDRFGALGCFLLEEEEDGT
jgi:hypothetical protein